ncbi:extensin-like [Thrips palmi]|uniref:Extensin-like n=1 Tax=Thrips palmi TaxID=161013 RepID=A0A6P8YQ48_THRPL|nr:extensin-like [Thrips palmi]
MTRLSWVRWLGVFLAVTVCAPRVPGTSGQIFPFSNLKHVFHHKAKGGAQATTPAETTTTSTTPEPPTTTTLAPYFGPYALLDDEEGYRHYVKPKASKPGKARTAKPAKQRAEESQQYPQHAARPYSAHPKPTTQPANAANARHSKRPSHLVPLKIAYEPTPSAPSEPLQEAQEAVDVLVAPPVYLTPPRLPANLLPVDDAAPSASSSSASPTHAPVLPMPPVPAVYLRPPGPPGPSGPPEPVLFKPSEPLQLADVAEAAVAQSTNPAIKTNTAPANHKLTPAPQNALPGSHTNKDKPAKLSNHRPSLDEGDAHDPLLVESSAAESAAQPQRAPKYKNHKPVPQPSGPPRPVRYHNHKPGGLDEQESMTSLRYRKRPLSPLEQEVSATGLQHAGSHPGYAGLSDGDRVEFQMHGLQGPKSYKFGYDTGNGQNRQFRYEERDPHGNVKGHYGYVDEHGKLQVVNYKADSQGGYKADVSKLHT